MTNSPARFSSLSLFSRFMFPSAFCSHMLKTLLVNYSTHFLMTNNKIAQQVYTKFWVMSFGKYHRESLFLLYGFVETSNTSTYCVTSGQCRMCSPAVALWCDGYRKGQGKFAVVWWCPLQTNRYWPLKVIYSTNRLNIMLHNTVIHRFRPQPYKYEWHIYNNLGNNVLLWAVFNTFPLHLLEYFLIPHVCIHLFSVMVPLTNILI